MVANPTVNMGAAILMTSLAKARAAGAQYLREFVEEMKATGFVAESLARHRIEGALVGPPAASR